MTRVTATDLAPRGEPAPEAGPEQASPAAPSEARRSLRERLVPPMPHDRLAGWLWPLAVTVLAGVLRFWDLGRPRAVVFDETYYMKDGLSLLRYGYERAAIEGADAKILDGVTEVFKNDPSFVVHPPFGKWVIGAGMQLFGVDPFGWRFSVALLGTLAVLMVARITRRLTRSTLIGTAAGLLMAVDGMAIVHSRTALLDQTVMFCALAAFGFLLIDRDRSRARLATLAEQRGLGDDGVGRGLGPWLWWRPWRVAAAVMLGLTIGTKWSGLWFLALFGLMTVVWDVGARRIVGVRRPWLATFLKDAWPAAIVMVGVAAAVYLACWWGWLVSDDGWGRQWAAENPGEGLLWLPEALRSLWHYHQEAWGFHVGLSSPHSYQSNPWSWPLQARPTSFFYESYKLGEKGCEVDSCAAEVIALGNPIVWWAATAALVHQAWRWLARRDWRSGAVLVGFIAGWAPWLLFQGRTVFTFYAIAFLPYMIMALAMSLGVVLGRAQASPNRRTWGAVVAGGVVLAAVAAGWFFYPIWTGQTIPYDVWHIRMWFPTWV